MAARLLVGALAVALVACSGDPTPCANCAADGRPPGDANAGGDQASGDQAPGDPTAGDPSDTTCGAPTDVTMSRLWPEPGELFYVQIGLGGFAVGESAITVWPNGEIVFIDVANNSHDNDVLAMLDALIIEIGTRGFPARAARTADHVILTHYHADHTDGLGSLLGSITLSGRVVYRGMVDLVGVNGGTVGSVCDTLAARPGVGLALCTGVAPAPCNDAGWTSTYPATSCSVTAATSLMQFSAESGIDFIAVNGHINGESYEAQNGPLLTENNGENARSIVGVLRHGAFRLLFNGDLTGGGSVTDPVEGFYIPRIAAVCDLDGRGVDVMHVGHHARNTSTSVAWADRLLPNDGRDRNVVMGVSEAHIRSPYQEVLDAIFTGMRLGAGFGWTNRVAFLGQTDARLLDAGGGHIVVRTHDGGSGYYVQSLSTSGAVLWTRRYDSVRACP